MRTRQVGGMALVIPLAEGECGEGLSGGLARIALEETAQTPSAVPFQWRIRLRGRSRDFSIRLDQGVADALVRSLRQIMFLELVEYGKNDSCASFSIPCHAVEMRDGRGIDRRASPPDGL